MFTDRSTLDLNGSWSFAWSLTPAEPTTIAQLQQSGLRTLDCQVPGNFELDLQKHGLIEEPFHGMNIAGLRQYEGAHVWYFRTFDLPPRPGTTPVLVLEGVDCFAEVYLNGQHIGSCANMLIAHTLPLTGARAEGNELLIHIRPAVEEARKFDYPPGLNALGSNYDAIHVRKAPHMYGWDIMPRAVSAGLWRPVHIEYLPVERIETLFLDTMSCSAREARLTLHFRARLGSEVANKYELEITGSCGDSTFHQKTVVLFEAGRAFVEISNPRLWWPRNRGPQSLYNVTVVLLKNGQPIDRAQFRHGIRSLELRRTSTTDNTGNGEFCFLVNGERVFIHGSNWVPADAYHSRDAERIPKILELVLDSGCNMLRCWGGNVYEPDFFFDFCDEHGILIWQDFAMACGYYPKDDAFCKALETEARAVVRRLRHHPSLALWAGDNECDQAYYWIKGASPEANRLTREVLPRVLQAEDPRRPYLPSSPYIDAEALKADESRLPENHLWGPRDYFKSPFYEQSLAHFASEMGYHGCPSPESIKKFISPAKLWPPGNDEWLLHSTSPIPGVNLYDYRIELMSNQIREMFGRVPDNLDDFAFQSQCVQAEAKKFFIELFRGAKWRRTGLLWWNLMDGWPQFSDAVVDYYFNKKLAYHFIRRVQQPVLVMFRESRGWNHDLVVCNDTRDTLDLHYTVRDLAKDKIIAEGHCAAAPDAVTLAQEVPYTRSEARFLVIEWSSAQGKGLNHYLSGNPPFDPAQYRQWIAQVYGH
ncbi:MAG: hypothetical protein B9S32_12540 [Verrucomicrobia bacterium Tous-C9LFEB]|nr:MAG: hypothetical protein B9S32_12540 [Verrucomicrobia bacterium Tous-C9LFEB]